MSEKQFTMKGSTILENGEEITAWDCCDLLNALNDENEQLQKKLMIVSAHLLSDECNLTESQIKNIIKEMENV